MCIETVINEKKNSKKAFLSQFPLIESEVINSYEN